MNRERIDFLKKDFSQGFISYLGCKAEYIDAGIFHSSLEIRQDHKQQDGFVHAGVIATMADHTAGYSAYTLVSENICILTIEFKINFFKPAIGDKLLCESEVIHSGKKLIISESNIYISSHNEQILISKALVSLMAIPIEKIAKNKI
ncbi:MAG: PaaI family thioesterase [Promethearchaeati archaeon]